MGSLSSGRMNQWVGVSISRSPCNPIGTKDTQDREREKNRRTQDDADALSKTQQMVLMIM